MPRDTVTVPSSEPLIIRKNEDGETVDEVIAKNCYFHIEQMSATGFWFCVNDSHFHIGSRNGRSHIDLTITDLDDRSAPSSDPEGGARGVQPSIATKRSSNESSASVLSDAEAKSAPDDAASHNSGERDPSVMPDYPGADTKSDGPDMTMRCCGQHAEDGHHPQCDRSPSDQLTKTPSADHDDGNLRATGGEA